MVWSVNWHSPVAVNGRRPVHLWSIHVQSKSLTNQTKLQSEVTGSACVSVAQNSYADDCVAAGRVSHGGIGQRIRAR